MPPVALSMLTSASRVSAPVWAEKPLTLMMPTLSFTSHLTGRSSIRSRVMETSNGLSRPGRTMVSLTVVPGLPRIFSTASSSVKP